MTSDPSLFIKKIRHLSQALIISGVLNIGVLSLLLYWTLRERLPTPYCELKPASFEQQQIPLADQRGCSEVLAHLSQLSLSQLINRLSNTQQIENGYAERDLALACLLAFHHFDLSRALPKNAQPQQKRLLAWKPKGQESSIILTVYPDLMQPQFESLMQFAKTERWPLTAEGLFLLLQQQKEKQSLDEHLIETFVLTPEFWTVELLFNRSGQHVTKSEILTVLLEGNWTLLKQFVDQQRQLHDASDARRQKFLLDYLKAGSPSSTILLLKMEWEFSVKKLEDSQVVTILQLMPAQLPESLNFAKEMLMSPRSTNVWKQASKWLYAQVGESIPVPWNYESALARFAPEKSMKLPLASPMPLPLSPTLPLPRPKIVLGAPIKPTFPPSLPPVSIAPLSQKKTSAPVNVKKLATAKKNKALSAIKPRTYVVQQGDSLWKIARRFSVKIDELKALNQLQSDVLKPGIVLKIPESSGKSSVVVY